MSAVWVLAMVWAVAPRVTSSSEAHVDAAAVASGVEARVGDVAESWVITLEPTPGGVRFQASAPGRSLVEQSVELPQGSERERAIAVASAVALAIEQSQDTEADPSAPSSKPAPARSGRAESSWMATLGAHVAVGVASPVSPSGGAELGVGRWLGPQRPLRVSLALGWTHARRRALSVNAVEPAVQLDAGSRLGTRVWLGAGCRIGLTTAWAQDRARARGSSLHLRVPATIEVDLSSRWFARGMLGLELRAPSLRFRGANDELRWGNLRPVAGLAIGANLP